MKFLFTQHIPAFVDTDAELRKVKFNTFEELYEDEWIKYWKNGFDGREFIKFEIRKDMYLMAHYQSKEQEGEAFYWCLGHIELIGGDKN